MKLNKKVVDLISEGFKANTLKNLTESQIDKLYERVMKKDTKEQITTFTKPPTKAYKVGSGGGKLPPSQKGYTMQRNPDGSMTATPEMTEGKKNKKKVNPWAVCTASVGRDDKEKYESCVKDVKKQNKGNLDLGKKKMDENLFIERKILNLVEKYTSPKMSKKEFLSLLEASETKEKPGVKEKPGTKTPPREKPHDPFKPAPHKQPKPKATKSEVDEDTVMDAPAKPKTSPTTKPGTKTPPREKPHDPFKPAPHKQPKPKAKNKFPEELKFSSLGIKLKK